MALGDKRGKKRPLLPPIEIAAGQEISIVAVVDLPIFFEDTSFVSGDSPVTLDLNAGLGRNATRFELINDGPGTFTVALSNDGAVFGDEYTQKAGETYPEKISTNISVDSIRLTHVTDSAFRCLVI